MFAYTIWLIAASLLVFTGGLIAFLSGPLYSVVIFLTAGCCAFTALLIALARSPEDRE
jgi:hypothetical protein